MASFFFLMFFIVYGVVLQSHDVYSLSASNEKAKESWMNAIEAAKQYAEQVSNTYTRKPVRFFLYSFFFLSVLLPCASIYLLWL